VWADDHSPLDQNGTSFVDSAYIKAFVRHLFVTNELLGLQIASLHNLAFYVALMTEARGKILDGTFSEWKAQVLPKLKTRITG
jgi:queuine tRNA-ribosyltransferase